MLSNYYKILGISPEASLEEVKRAYRRRAKELHPDRNPSPQAHQEFVALSEAYDLIIGYRKGRIRSKSAHTSRRRGRTRANRQTNEEEERQKAHAKAEEYARMKYEAYKNTDQYKDSLALEVATRFATLLTSIFLLIVLPIIACLYFESSGRIATVIISIFGAPVWYDVVRNPSKYLDFTDLGEAMGRVIQFEGFQTVASLIVNGLIFVYIGLDTLLDLQLQITCIIGLGAIGWLLATFTSLKKIRPALSLGFGPLLFTSLLLVNSLGAHSPVTESYSYRLRQGRQSDGSVQRNVLITLKDDAYQEFMGMRFFLNGGRGHYTVDYTIAEGTLGWRVVTECEFR